ncbi:MAG: 16S rRNA (cytosine(1402)-N(4))-methyltransferase RsmH [Alphaproteobacteria bacterium]|nr:16S rRNA (cytosine(1402)-N(4))-methyltransferase RsmH [Alphaproteobacteria bacterium]
MTQVQPRDNSPHYSVMLTDVMDVLSPKDGEVYIDGTFGAGGYSRAFLQKADCTVIAIDRDPSVQETADQLRTEFGDRFVFLRGCFGDALELVRDSGFERVDGFVVDVGVSSMQIDQADRGFSFKQDGPLDMRMDSDADLTAEDIVNSYKEEDLANIIYRYGEERMSRRVAKRIVEKRSEERITTTLQLADIVRAVVPKSPKDKIDPATRTFQALRIAVNDELGELERGLSAAEEILNENGRLIVVSFHSLEDGIVKSFLNQHSGRVPNVSKYMPSIIEEVSPSFTLIKRKAFVPSDAEIQENPRSRSAKMRAALRTSASPIDETKMTREGAHV